jgi:hypothetical protein
MSCGRFERAGAHGYALERVAFSLLRRQQLPLSCGNATRACSSAGQSASLTTTNRSQFPQAVDQQEQPVAQVSDQYSLSSK